MSPMPRHGREAYLLARIVEALLDSAGRNYEAFTPITMNLPEDRGIEPDYCFYIDNWAAVVGKDRIQWASKPPPDLVIEYRHHLVHRCGRLLPLPSARSLVV